jgi:hypothetical protein
MNKQRHDVGYREFRPHARIDERANALARHQRYDSGGSGPSRVFCSTVQQSWAYAVYNFPPGYPGAGVARKTQRRT